MTMQLKTIAPRKANDLSALDMVAVRAFAAQMESNTALAAALKEQGFKVGKGAKNKNITDHTVTVSITLSSLTISEEGRTNDKEIIDFEGILGALGYCKEEIRIQFPEYISIKEGRAVASTVKTPAAVGTVYGDIRYIRTEDDLLARDIDNPAEHALMVAHENRTQEDKETPSEELGLA